MNDDKWIVVFKADNLIERDALVAQMAFQGIEARIIERPTSRRISEDTVDLAFEGVSSLFDGFPILVQTSNEDKAKALVTDFFKRRKLTLDEPEIPGERRDFHFHKYYFCGIFSSMLPVVLHGYGIYHFIKGVKKREPLRPAFFVFSSALFVGSGVLVFYWITEFLRSL
ncbi:MAG: hypothetical protein V4736_08370 [Bdellovibrionota bacterium]